MIEKFDGEHQLFHANPEPYTSRFQGDTGELGKLIYGPEGELTFEGEADECAQIFFDHVIECNNSKIDRLRSALESIRANSAPNAVSLSPKVRIEAFHQICVDALE
jgi:hypothetical protein